MENSTCLHYCNLWQPYIPGYKYIYIYILYIYIIHIYIYIYIVLKAYAPVFQLRWGSLFKLLAAVTYQAARKGKAKTRASHLMATPWLSQPGSHPEKATKSESCQSDYHLGGPSLGQYPTGSIPETRNKPPRHRCPPTLVAQGRMVGHKKPDCGAATPFHTILGGQKVSAQGLCSCFSAALREFVQTSCGGYIPGSKEG